MSPKQLFAMFVLGIRRLIITLLLGCIRAYRLLLSPLLPPSCRFLPTCSAYAEEAIRCHGLLYGTWLALWRLMRCHPWGGSGLDPVPGLYTPRVTGEVNKANNVSCDPCVDQTSAQQHRSDSNIGPTQP